MKKSILLPLMLLATTSFAQFSLEWNFTYDWDRQYFEYTPIKYTPPENVERITFNYTSKKDVRTYSKTFDNGKLTSYTYKNKKNELVKEARLAYDDRNELSEFKMFRKGKLKSTSTYSRNDEGKPLSQKKTNAKDILTSYTTWSYNDDGCLSELVYYKKGGEKILSRWVMEYRDKCERSKSRSYNGKGKLLREWTYDCKAEGEALEKKKNTTQVCRWEEFTPDVMIKVFETFDDKGKTVKDVTKYTIGDTLILEWARYNHKNELIYKTTYDKDQSKPLSYESFRKGKSRYSSFYIYEENRLISATSFKGDKKIGKSSYTYNQDNLLTNFVYVGKKDAIYKEINVVY